MFYGESFSLLIKRNFVAPSSNFFEKRSILAFLENHSDVSKLHFFGFCVAAYEFNLFSSNKAPFFKEI